MVLAFSAYSLTPSTKLYLPSLQALNIAARAYCEECEAPDDNAYNTLRIIT